MNYENARIFQYDLEVLSDSDNYENAAIYNFALEALSGSDNYENARIYHFALEVLSSNIPEEQGTINLPDGDREAQLMYLNSVPIKTPIYTERGISEETIMAGDAYLETVKLTSNSPTHLKNILEGQQGFIRILIADITGIIVRHHRGKLWLVDNRDLTLKDGDIIAFWNVGGLHGGSGGYWRELFRTIY